MAFTALCDNSGSGKHYDTHLRLPRLRSSAFLLPLLITKLVCIEQSFFEAGLRVLASLWRVSAMNRASYPALPQGLAKCLSR